jgi:hypothetical protein
VVIRTQRIVRDDSDFDDSFSFSFDNVELIAFLLQPFTEFGVATAEPEHEVVAGDGELEEFSGP